MARTCKVPCDNCPARNRRVRPYLLEGKRKDLCIDCVKTAVRLELKIENL